MKNKVLFYFTDNSFHFFYKEKLVKEKNNNLTFEDRISSIKVYIETISNIIKKNKLNNNLLSNKITIIIPAFYLDSDEYLITSIYEKLGFTDIDLVKENSILNIKEKTAIIKISKNYLIYYFQFNNQTNYKYISFNQFIDIEEDVVNLIEKYNKEYDINKCYTLGDSKKIAIFITNLEKNRKTKYYTFKNSETYFIDLLTFH